MQTHAAPVSGSNYRAAAARHSAHSCRARGLLRRACRRQQALRVVSQATASPSAPSTTTLDRFVDPAGKGKAFATAIMGDLHLAPEQMHLFEAARAQLVSHTAQLADPGSARVVQLGDLGHGKHQSGSRKCFDFARAFLDGFGLPRALVTGK